MSSQVAQRLAQLLAQFFPLLEPLTPRYISFLIKRRLRRLKNNGLLLGYRTRTKRIGRLHYRLDVELDLTVEQASRLLRQMIGQLVKRR
jgi:hypothetical protein